MQATFHHTSSSSNCSHLPCFGEFQFQELGIAVILGSPHLVLETYQKGMVPPSSTCYYLYAQTHYYFML